MKIRDIFDESRKIDRRIEKVVTFANIENDLLKREINEYVVTRNIEECLLKMLDILDSSGTGSKGGETCFWVSGFYGSGKSSLTKYLGFAFDKSILIDSQPFLKSFLNQITNNEVKARLNAVAQKNPMVVIMLDLATQQIDQNVSGISEILYWHVMRWAGYSKDMKIAYLESMLETDGRYEEFKEKIKQLATDGKGWQEIKDKPLIAKTFASKLASEFYPSVWKTDKAFNDIKIEEFVSAEDKVKQMLNLIKRKSGQENILFILDEVGQYIAPREHLILNLDGLAKNIKGISGGKAFIMATAQQTLTEDDPRIQVNTANLFKLKDRFPISIKLEADDIKEITYKRLLAKSSTGELELKKIFQAHGATMRHATQLTNLKQFSREITEKEFCDLYPFLPQHFDILMTLINKLAKTSGGTGLRSSLKVIQDTLIEKIGNGIGESVLADKPLGTLVNAETFYDSLRSDIKSSFRHLGEAVDTVERIWNTKSIQHRVSKAIAILQLVTEAGVTVENIAAILFDRVEGKDILSEVKIAIDEMQKNRDITLNEVDGSLRFMSEAVNDLDKKKLQFLPRQSEVNEAFLKILKEIFKSQPSAIIFNTKKIETGIEINTNPNGKVIEGKDIFTQIEFVLEQEMNSKKEELLNYSTQPSQKNKFFWLSSKVNIDAELIEITQCNKIYELNHAKEKDKEILDYLVSQKQRAQKLEAVVELKIKDTLKNGIFIFRRQPIPTINLGVEPILALNKLLADKGKDIYDRFEEASINADAKLAENFLNTDKLDRIKAEHDPLKLVIKTATNAKIKVDAPCIHSVKDFLNNQGRQEGRLILEQFSKSPFGWSPDTTRYILAAMITGGLIQIISGSEELTVRGPKVIELLRSPSSFKRISIALRENTPSPEWLKRASERLIKLTGEPVLPLEDQISNAVKKYFPDFQRKYYDHGIKLAGLGLPGQNRARVVQEGLANILLSDASQAYSILGTEICEFYENLIWSSDLQKAFDNHIDKLVQEVVEMSKGIQALPQVEKINELRINANGIILELADYLKMDSFFEKKAELSSRLAELKQEVEKTAIDFIKLEEANFHNSLNELQSDSKYSIVSLDIQETLSSHFNGIKFEASHDLKGIREILNLKAEIATKFQLAYFTLDKEVELKIKEQEEESTPDSPQSSYHLVQTTQWPREIKTEKELDEFIEILKEYKTILQQNTSIKFIF